MQPLEESTIDKFLSLLLSEPKGRIVGCNILSCHTSRLVGAPWMRKTMRQVLLKFSQDEPRTCTELIGLLEREWTESLFAGPVSAALGADDRQGYVHVIRYERFLTLLDPAVLASEGIRIENPCETTYGSIHMEALNMLGEHGRGLRDPGRGIMNLGYCTLWLAPFSDRVKTADDARDLMGLVHHGDNVSLVSVKMPHDVIEARHCHRPTFADAGSHRRFRQRPDRCRPRNFGRAVDLAKHRAEPLSSPVDGALETVTTPLPFNPELQATWWCLGCTTKHGERDKKSSRADDEMDEIFFNRLLRGRRLIDIRAKLERIIKNHCRVPRRAGKV